MSTTIEQRVSKLEYPEYRQTITGIRRGIEKESLRVSSDGHLAQSPHPKGLGAALTHPAITTDYSEALLELITPAYTDINETLTHLRNSHIYTYQQIQDELLWVNSMPCIMSGDENIPIAQYGSSNIGKMKTIYRQGLGLRYGRLMQTISGIHYNFSLPEGFWAAYQQTEKNQHTLQDFTSASYFDLVRNFQRFNPLLIYLFGASPALCASFVQGNAHNLHSHINENTLHRPFATSLRMSDLGYQNDAQSRIQVNYNSLPDYARTLRDTMHSSYAPYENMGLKSKGQYQQLNTNILQIENEYYGQIRPKRTTASGERPTSALLSRGVEYIEMRCLDLNPFLDVGIDEEQMRFLDIFGLYCLLKPSAPLSTEERNNITDNHQVVVMEGRSPEARMKTLDGTPSFTEWAKRIWEELPSIAALLDGAYGTRQYQKTLDRQYEKIIDSSQTPSARILAELEQNKISFFEFAMYQSQRNKNHFRQMVLLTKDEDYYKQAAQDSIKQQQSLEENDAMPFETYLERYLNSQN